MLGEKGDKNRYFSIKSSIGGSTRESFQKIAKFITFIT